MPLPRTLCRFLLQAAAIAAYRRAVLSKQIYAARRTMPNGSGSKPSFACACGPWSGHRPSSIRHSLASYSA
jgi:hypothetical protein